MTTPVKRVIPCPPGFSDHIYKVEQGVSIPLRVWPAPATAGNGKPAPWLLWIHGGALFGGKHYVPNTWVHPAFHARGYHIVSIAYRFIPEAWLGEIVQDCLDALAWCRTNLPEVAPGIDVDSYVVGGDSAGGSLSTLFGHLAVPRPKVVLNLYGMVDLLDFLHKSNPQPIDPKYTRRDPTRAEITCPWTWELPPNMTHAELRSFWGAPDFVVEDKYQQRMDALGHVSSTGNLMTLWIRTDECANREEEEQRAKQWSATHLLDSPTAAGYPPTFIMHGEADSVVSIEQSRALAKRLRERGVPVGEAYSPDGEHCFDQKFEGPEDEGWHLYILPCMEFVEQYIKK